MLHRELRIYLLGLHEVREVFKRGVTVSDFLNRILATILSLQGQKKTLVAFLSSLL